jgi:hypothetical protein
MSELQRYNWKCTFNDCPDTLGAYSEASLETIKSLHLEGHYRRVASAERLAGLCVFSVSDRRMLRIDFAIDPDGQDLRSADELAGRYKPRV